MITGIQDISISKGKWYRFIFRGCRRRQFLPALVAGAAEAIRRGAESVLHPRGAGAIMRLRGLVIHDVDFAPQQFERHTAEELLRTLKATS